MTRVLLFSILNIPDKKRGNKSDRNNGVKQTDKSRQTKDKKKRGYKMKNYFTEELIDEVVSEILIEHIETRVKFENSLKDILELTGYKDYDVKVNWENLNDFESHKEILLIKGDKVIRTIPTKGNSFLSSYKDLLNRI